jgi:hypothetical protein
VKQPKKSWSIAVTLALAITGFAQERACAQAPSPDPVTLAKTPDLKDWAELAYGFESRHPVDCYLWAMELFALGRRDDAVFMFYLGQLRWRIHLMANPQFFPGNEPAVFEGVTWDVGEVLNRYAFGDIPVLARSIQAVLDFDAAYPDRFTADPEIAGVQGTRPATVKHKQDVREGLARLRKWMLDEADTIRSKRRDQGLENRD